MTWTTHIHATPAELATHAASMLEACIRDALATRGRAVLALAGGQTPWPVYRTLAQADLDWSRVLLVPTDERCVPLTHAARNEAAIERAFEAADGVQVLHLVPADGDATQAQAYARQALAAVDGDFDAVVLGMGGDGHTASLFPGATALPGAMAGDAPDALRIDPQPLPPEAPFPRITLTLPRLLRARAIHLLVTGEAKRAVLQRAQVSGDAIALPVAAVLHADGDVQVHWSP